MWCAVEATDDAFLHLPDHEATQYQKQHPSYSSIAKDADTDVSGYRKAASELTHWVRIGFTSQ
jgi:hypothetical protein